MEGKRSYHILKILGIIFWTGIAVGTGVLLVAAMHRKVSMPCTAVDINISGVQNNFFIDKHDVSVVLGRYTNNKLVGKMASSFNLAAIENELQKNEWIKHAEVYFDNNEVLKVKIIEREPIARVFCVNGSSFYIDTARMRLPLSAKFSARVPVFSNFPTENIVLSKTDSNLLTGMRKISEFIFKDSFWMAQIDQIDITPGRTFEMTPKIGNQVIVFGNADNYEQKFSNLLMFYKKVENRVGWNKYSKLDLRFKGQVVAVKNGTEEIKTDSLRTKELMQLLVSNALKQANDSIHNIQLVQGNEDNTIPTMVNEEITPPEAVRNLLNTPASKVPLPGVAGYRAGIVASSKNQPFPKSTAMNNAHPGNQIVAGKKPLLIPALKRPGVKLVVKKIIPSGKQSGKNLNNTNDY